MDFITILMVAGIIGVYFFYLKALGRPKKNHEDRMNAIKEKVQLIGGDTIAIEQTKKSDKLFEDTEFKDDGSYYVCYKVKYELDGEEKVGGAVLKLEQTYGTYIGVTDNRWTWVLDL